MNELYNSHAIETLDKRSFDDFIQHGIVLVGFMERWCGPCHMQLPILERVAQRVSGHATVALVNIDESAALAAHFNIEAIPTLVLFQNGQVKRRWVGVHSEPFIIRAILTLTEVPAPDLPPLP